MYSIFNVVKVASFLSIYCAKTSYTRLTVINLYGLKGLYWINEIYLLIKEKEI